MSWSWEGELPHHATLPGGLAGACAFQARVSALQRGVISEAEHISVRGRQLSPALILYQKDEITLKTESINAEARRCIHEDNPCPLHTSGLLTYSHRVHGIHMCGVHLGCIVERAHIFSGKRGIR